MDFGSAIRRFESSRPSTKNKINKRKKYEKRAKKLLKKWKKKTLRVFFFHFFKGRKLEGKSVAFSFSHSKTTFFSSKKKAQLFQWNGKVLNLKKSSAFFFTEKNIFLFFSPYFCSYFFSTLELKLWYFFKVLKLKKGKGSSFFFFLEKKNKRSLFFFF